MGVTVHDGWSGMGQGGSGGIRRTQEASTTSQPVQIGNAGGRSMPGRFRWQGCCRIEGLYDQGEALSPDLLATGVSITLDGQTVGTLFAQRGT